MLSSHRRIAAVICLIVLGALVGYTVYTCSRLSPYISTYYELDETVFSNGSIQLDITDIDMPIYQNGIEEIAFTDIDYKDGVLKLVSGDNEYFFAVMSNRQVYDYQTKSVLEANDEQDKKT